MKVVVVLCLFAVGAFSQLEHDGDFYDKVDIKKIIENDDTRIGAFACLMDRGPCEDYPLIKEVVPRILKTKCGDCSPAQKAVYESTSKYLETNYNANYKEMVAKFA